MPLSFSKLHIKTSCADCSGDAIIGPRPASGDLNIEQPPTAFKLEVTVLVGDMGHCTPSVHQV